MELSIKTQFSRISSLMALTILLVVSVFVFTAPYSHAAQNIVDGDLVTVSPNPDIYIVKIIGVKKFKRLILNPDIFNSYGNLKWSNVKTIDQIALDLYKLSEFVIEVNPDGSIADPKVYKVASSGNSDVGQRRWLNLTASEFEVVGYDWDSIYHINHREAAPDFYPTKEPYTYQNALQEKQGEQATTGGAPVSFALVNGTEFPILYGSNDLSNVQFRVVDVLLHSVPKAVVGISKNNDTTQTYITDNEGLVSYQLPSAPETMKLKLISGTASNIFTITTHYYALYPLAGLSVYGNNENGKPIMTFTNTTEKEDIIIKSIRIRVLGTVSLSAIASVKITSNLFQFSFPVDSNTGYIIQSLPTPITVKSSDKFTFDINFSESQTGKTYGFNFENSDDIWGSISTKKIMPNSIAETSLLAIQ